MAIQLNISFDGPGDDDKDEESKSEPAQKELDFESIPNPDTKEPEAPKDLEDKKINIPKPQPAPPPADADNPKAPDIASSAADDRMRKKAEREYINEQKKEIQKQYSDANTNLRREFRDKQREIRSKISDLRQQNISKRAQMYGIASIIGFKGHTVAAAADKLYFEPKHNEELSNLRKEQDDLLKALDRALDENRSAREEAINSINPQNDISSPPPIEGTDGGAPPPSPPSSPGIGPGLPNIPPPPPTPLPTQTGRGGSGKPPGPPNPPIPPHGGNGPTLPPIGPGATPNPLFNAASIVVPIVAGLIEVKKAVDQQTSQQVQRAINTYNRVIDKDPVGTYKGLAETATNFSLDGLGIIKPLKGMEPMLDSQIAILSSIDKNTEKLVQQFGFAMPKSLSSSIQGDVNSFFNQMRNAERIDPIVASLVDAKAEFGMAVDDLTTSLTKAFGPSLDILIRSMALLIEGGAVALDTAVDIFSLISDYMKMTNPLLWGSEIANMIASAIYDKLKQGGDAGMDDVLRQFQDFTDPDKFGRKIPAP